MGKQAKKNKQKEGAAKASGGKRAERCVQSTHQTVIDGETIDYTASVGTLTLKDDKDLDRASFFYTSYVRQGVDSSKRPVTFCFNGGPGSASVWLHLGVFGPRRIDMPDVAAPGPPPYDLVDNASGILDQTDLVFIDPIGTGYSRPQGKAKAEDFHSTEKDVESVGEFIELWLTRNDRWNAPKFLAGESFGTTRAAGLALHLVDRGIAVNGLILISVALDFQAFVFEAGNDLPNAMFLPTYTAVAHYHGRLPDPPDDLDVLLDEVRAFALDEYMPALMKGSRLDESTRMRLAIRLASYTGLDAAEIAARSLRIKDMWFTKQVLPQHGATVGRMDGRIVGRDHDQDGLDTAHDPSLTSLMGPYTAIANDYLRRELGWKADEAYTVLSYDVNGGWDWRQKDRMGFLSVADSLRKAIISNPHMRVLMMNGKYDLATPFFSAEYTADHLDPSGGSSSNIQHAYYEAGHMMYIHPPSLSKMRVDLLAFYGA